MAKKIVITGATSGIGRGLALWLAKAGHSLALIGRNQERLQEVAELSVEAGAEKVSGYAVDMSDTSAFEDVVGDIAEDLGGIDVLINAAGLGHSGNVMDVDVNKWAEMIQVNLTSLITMTHHCLQHIKSSKAGAVINISSGAGLQGVAGSGGYSSSKFGVVGFGQSLFEDIRNLGIKVCTICPGFVDTPMVANYNVDPNKMIAIDDISKTVDYVFSLSPNACPVQVVIRPQTNPAL